MFSATSARLAILSAAAALVAPGCAPSGGGPPSADSSRAPRQLELPSDVRPIQSQIASTDHDVHSVPVHYQQPQSAAAVGPRIVGVSAPAGATSPSVVREPAAASPVITDPSPPPPRRSQFNPIAMPDPGRPPQGAAPPMLAARPDFAPLPSRGAGVIVEPAGPYSPHAGPPPAQRQPQQAAAAQSTPSNAGTRPQTDTAFRSTVTDPAATQIAAQRAMQIADHAAALAQRGMLYSARTELLQALSLVAQALDAQHGTGHHAAALAAGLRALEEARDFSSRASPAGDAVNVAAIAAAHRTPQLNNTQHVPPSPLAAQQQYFAQAQAQLTAAVGAHPAGSQILYRLGRLQMAMSAHDADPLALHGPQAIAFHQAALATDKSNWLAANELGVLYARYGNLAEARQLLQHSVSIQPHVAGWQNLAAVHRRLGENDLAERAEHEGSLLARQSKSPAEASGIVRWVDTKTFAVSGGPDIRWPADTAGKAVAASRK